MDRKKVEGYVFISLFILPTLVFIITPAHSMGGTGYRLNDFLNQYLFGNGWYSPSNYPFAAKVTNNFSVIWAIATGLFTGIWRRNDIIVSLMPKNAGWYFLLIVALGLYLILKSYYPQEFSVYNGRRSFVFTEYFHNNPIFFWA